MRGAAREGDPSSPERVLGALALFSLGVNGIVGVGIFFTPHLVAGLVPDSLGVWAYALSGLALLPIALAYARLGSRFDGDGGPYVWARAAFGEGAGFVVGMAAYASAVLSTSAVLAGLGEYLAPALGFASHQRLFSLISAATFAAVVLTGLKPSAKVWASFTVLKLIPLLLLVAAFLVSSGAPVIQSAPTHVVSWSRALLLIVFPLQGFEIVPVPGSQVRQREWSVPLATIGSLAFCVGLYMLLHWVCVRAVPGLALTDVPFVRAAQVLGGNGLVRPSMVGSQEPGTAQAVSRRALLVTLVLVVLLLSWGALQRLFVLSSVAVLFQYSVSVLALARLALGRRHGFLPRDARSAPFSLAALVTFARAVERAELYVLSGILLASRFLVCRRRRHAAS